MHHQIGKGNFSTVYRLTHNNHTCAMKLMMNHRSIARKEAQILSKLTHPNIIKLYKYEEDQEGYKLFMEYLPIDALTLYESEQYGLKEEQVKCILFQLALALSYIHAKGIIHRDIKPENILINKPQAIIKLIDFGLAIPQTLMATDYIATRWYRSPENLLATKEYSTAIDIFSLGCVIVELYLGNPLFPGFDNIDQIYRIFNILGYPTINTWPQGFKSMEELGILHTHTNSLTLQQLLAPCNTNFIDIISKMLILSPRKRITAWEICQHPYFHDIQNIIPPQVYKYYQDSLSQALAFRSNKHIKPKNPPQQPPQPPQQPPQPPPQLQQLILGNSKQKTYLYTERSPQPKKQMLSLPKRTILPNNISPDITKPTLKSSRYPNLSLDKSNLIPRQSIQLTPIYSPKYHHQFTPSQHIGNNISHSKTHAINFKNISNRKMKPQHNQQSLIKNVKGQQFKSTNHGLSPIKQQHHNQHSMRILQPFSPTNSPRISIDILTRN